MCKCVDLRELGCLFFVNRCRNAERKESVAVANTVASDDFVSQASERLDGLRTSLVSFKETQEAA